MNKRKISKLMQEMVPGLRNCGVYFFRPDFDQILQGVVLEYVPRGLYIWDFRLPLYDYFGPNLSFSDRLSDRPFVGKGEMSEEDLVHYVMAAPEVKTNFDGGVAMSIEEFDRILELKYSHSPRSQLVRATGCVLQGKDELAVEILVNTPRKMHASNIAYLDRLKASIDRGHEAALEVIEEIRQANLRAFDLV